MQPLVLNVIRNKPTPNSLPDQLGEVLSLKKTPLCAVHIGLLLQCMLLWDLEV